MTTLARPSRAVVRFYNTRGTAEQGIEEGKQATHWPRLSCHRFRANEVRLQLSVLAYNLGNLWRRLGLPHRIKSWSLTSLQQRRVKTGGRLVKHARYYWLLLAEGHLTRRLFGDMQGSSRFHVDAACADEAYGWKNVRRRNLAVRGGIRCIRALIRAAKTEIPAECVNGDVVREAVSSLTPGSIMRRAGHMDARMTLWWRRTRRLVMATATVAVLGVGFFVWPAEPIVAQDRDAPGVIAGSVTADRGEVRAFRVKARDPVHKIAYVVFTTKGRYQIFNVPPGTYDVGVLEDGFESSVQTVDVKPGATQTVNLALKANAAALVQGAFGGDAYRGTGRSANTIDPDTELVDYDTLYPPSPARDILEKACFSCHGLPFYHRRRASEEAWRRGINRMYAIGMMRSDIVSDGQKESIVKYLASNFGPDAKPRALKMEPLVRDEAALAQALYIEYELPPPAPGPAYSNTGAPPRRGVHSVFLSQVTPGVLWGSDIFANSIVRLDTRNPDPTSRFTEYKIENPKNLNTTPHGIVEERGRVYWVERLGDHLGELDPQTGEIRRYPIPTTGGHPHSVRADSRGMLWYSFWAATSKIGRFDTRTKQFTEFDNGARRWNGYGITVDRQDRVWAVGMSTPAGDPPLVHMYNQETGQWKAYQTSGSTRRQGVDSKGKVWASQYFGNAISKIDPVTGQVTNYELPLNYGNPYEIWPDLEDNLWVGNRAYGSLVRFDQQTEQFTYFPYPEPRARTPKLEVDDQGTLWFALNYSQPIVAFRPKGNVPMRRSSQ